MKKITYTALLALLMTFVLANSLNAASATELEKGFLAKIDELMPGMGDPVLVKRKGPQLTFERICFDNSSPDKQEEREALCKAIMKRVGPDVAMPARVWLLRKVESLGREEVVKGLAELMHDENARIRELARRALQNNPSKKAAAVLREELDKAECCKWRVALINALAFRRDAKSIKALAKLAGDKDVDVARAAVAALGKITHVASVRILNDLNKAGRSEISDEVIDALMRNAEFLCANGSSDTAFSIYEKLYDASQPEHIRIAALNGMTAAGGAKVVPQLLKAIKGDDQRMQMIAVQCAELVAGSKATEKLAAAMDEASPEIQVLLMEILGNRGDRAALPAVKKRAEHADENIRLAALRTLKDVGDDSVVMFLAERAAKTKGIERNTARESLAWMRGPKVDETILKKMKTGQADVRAELIKATSARGMREAIPALYAAAGDGEEAVRSAAILALGVLAPNEDFAKLVDLLVNAATDKTRMAAEIALTEVSLRRGNKSQRVAPIVKVLPDTNPTIQASLIRVLAKIGGNEAFKVIDGKRDAENEMVKNAAVRALAGWKDPVALDSLWIIATSSGNQEHRVKALRGYVRLCRMPTGRDAADTFAMLAGAMKLAKSVEDKKLVLAALGDVPHVKTLEFLSNYLKDPAFKAEAQDAVVRMAVGLSSRHYQDAVAAVERVHEAATSEETKAQASKTLDTLRTHCVSWQMSKLYKKKGVSGLDLADVAFPPESDPNVKADWKRLEVKDMQEPGRFYFRKGGRECCVYFKSSIWSDKEQPARFAIGSDDGVKVWLNGEVVHKNKVARGCQCGEDKVAVTLKAGWNPLLVKVLQGGGGWGFCSLITKPDGSPLKGLNFKAE